MNTKPETSKSDVLHAFSTEANPDNDTLAKYLERYPQFRESLIDLSIELYLAPALDRVPDELLPSENAKRAWSKFQSMLNNTGQFSDSSSATANPLANLSDQRFRELAEELNINRLFLSRFRDCSIQVVTIPRWFLLQLANALGVTVVHLHSALQAPSTLASAQRFKASGKPGLKGQITFEDALTQSGLTIEQQVALQSGKD